MAKDKKEDKQVGVKSTPPFKLKNTRGKDAVRINLLDTFGFVPEDIIISRTRSSGVRIQVHAVLTPEEQKKHDRLMKEKADQ